MQTMTALVRVSGNRDMTVQRSMVTPAEALVLMHVHDPATKDVFEHAKVTGEVQRSKTDERTRLIATYPEQGELINKLFPGRTASDIPDNFDELEGVPLEVVVEGRRERATRETQAEVEDAKLQDADDFAGKPVKAPAKKLSAEESRAAFGAGKR